MPAVWHTSLAVHGTVFHAPLELHVCTPLPSEEHCVVPGEQEPEQEVPTHAEFVQAVTVGPQLPELSQVRKPLLVVEHLVLLGEQEPMHAPLEHAEFVQAVTVVPQVPEFSQVR